MRPPLRRVSAGHLWKGGLAGVGLFVLAGVGYAITQGVFSVEQSPETQAFAIAGLGGAVAVVLVNVGLAVVLEEENVRRKEAALGRFRSAAGKISLWQDLNLLFWQAPYASKASRIGYLWL